MSVLEKILESPEMQYYLQELSEDEIKDLRSSITKMAESLERSSIMFKSRMRDKKDAEAFADALNEILSPNESSDV